MNITPKCSLISQAILSLNPSAEFIARNEYENITWLNGTKPISEKLIESEIKRLSTINQYQEARIKEYPTIQQQMDMQYWDRVNGTTSWFDAIQAVKDKYPKPE